MVIGSGSAGRVLSVPEIRNLCEGFFEREHLEGKRTLAIIPDHTRSGPIDIMAGVAYDLLTSRGGRLDFLIALGTHPPMSDEAIDKRLGLAPGERAARFPGTRVFNHHWKGPGELLTIGTISGGRVAELSGGRMHDPVAVRINKLVLEYDALLIIGPTFPHEVVGFSGGNKYLFPGISGQEIIDMFHWLGALITSPSIIGRKSTPVRAVVDAAASLLPVRRLCLSLVVTDDGLAGLFCGTPEEAWSSAADLSEQVHIAYKEHPFRTVLSCAPSMYDELWVGAKAAYKLEPVVADGGELIIYAPHIKTISVTHGPLIERVGYHVRDYFLRQMDRFAGVPGGVLAHSTHVKGIGTYENGQERPRINVVLATGIAEETCRNVNLEYRDPLRINPDDWKNREDEGVLHVPRAGEILYRLRDDPFALPGST